MALPLVFTANGREPPGRHLSSTRFQNTFSTGVEAALASLLSFASEQPDGDRSHCGTPGRCATALVPEGRLRCRVHKGTRLRIPRESLRVRRLTAYPKTLPLWRARRLRRPRNRSWRVCCAPKRRALTIQVSSWRKRVSPWRNKFHRANAKFTQPEVRPAPERPHRSSQNVNRRDNCQHHYAGALVAG